MPTTPPPNPSLSLPQGTPVHTRSSTTDQLNPQYDNQPGTLIRLADEMTPFIVGPIRAQDFLNHFLPCPSDSSSLPQFEEGIFKGLIDLRSEKENTWYDRFVSSDPPHRHYS
jgi:hypothetical protein